MLYCALLQHAAPCRKHGLSEPCVALVQAKTLNAQHYTPASGQSAAAYAAAAVARRQLQTAGWARAWGLPGCCWSAPLHGKWPLLSHLRQHSVDKF